MEAEIKFPRYDSYKDSGIEWVGDIPNDWETLPIRAIFHERREKNIGPKTEFILSVMKDRGVIPYDEKGNVGNKKSENIENYKVVYPGDLVINKMNAIIGSLGISNYHGALSQVYIVLYPRDYSRNDHRYLGYLFKVKPFQMSLIKIGKGIMELRESIEFDEFKKLYLPLPTLDEQNRIANFLDQKTAEIDKAVAKKQRLIELLKEQKAILINQTVTRGLNPDVPMRDSGVEWIGDIPAHWEIKRLRYIGTTQNGISAGAEYFGTGYPFVSYGDVYNNMELPYNVKGLAKSSVHDRKQYSVNRGDVLFTRTSETVEEIGFASTCMETIENSTFAGFLIRFRPYNNRSLIPGYSKFYFSAQLHRAYFVGEMNLVIRASLSQELLKKLPVILPPKREQRNIVNFLEAISTEFKKAILLQEQQIDKLKEYKTILISNAVTGKIKI